MKTHLICSDGFLTDLFDTRNNDIIMDISRINNHLMVHGICWKNYNDTLSMDYNKNGNKYEARIEWIGNNSTLIGSKYALYFQNNLYKPKSYFNTSMFRGWLNNIYVRWLGFKHRKDKINYDSVYTNHKFIDNNTLDNAKQTLLKYDHILILDKSNPLYLPQNNINWKHFLNEFKRISLNRYKETSSSNITINLNNITWLHKYNSDIKERIIKNDISTNKYKSLIKNNNELNILYKYNLLDIKLYEFGKSIDFIDEYFTTFFFE